MLKVSSLTNTHCNPFQAFQLMRCHVLSAVVFVDTSRFSEIHGNG